MENELKKKKPIFKKWWFWVLIIILIIMIKALSSPSGSSSTGNTKNTTKTGVNESSKPKQEDKKYSYSKFMQINMGMTYDQVKGILGDGTEESSSGDGDLKTVSYSWKNDDGSNISVMVQGNKVTNKAQAFLQSMDAKVTLAQYNKINNGITYDQVKAILGEGELSSQGKIMDSTSEIYSWINSDGSNMNVTFQNNKVESKAQFELK